MSLSTETMASRQDQPATTSSAAAPPQLPTVVPAVTASPRASLDTVHSHDTTRPSSRREYLDSLVVPSEDELDRISGVQADREAEQRRRSREDRRRRSSAASSRPATAASGPDGALAVPTAPAVSHSRKTSLSQRLGLSRAKAAIIIQRHYRSYRTRRELKGLSIDANTRWVHAIREAQYRRLTRPEPRRGDDDDNVDTASVVDEAAKSGARRNWRKAAVIVRRAGFDADSDTDSGSDSDSDSDSDSSSNSESDSSSNSSAASKARKRRAAAKAKRRAEARMMGLQYFLEMVDPRHRYGANLRVYHEEWKRANTHENFFYWLDRGAGRHIDMAACPREQLDREQVRYLSREERQYYLATVDAEGRLCWIKNGARIDTTEKWKDSIHGIVPADDPTPAFQPVSTHHTTKLLGDGSSSSSDSSDDDDDDDDDDNDYNGHSVSESDLEAARATKYAASSGTKKINHFSATTVFDSLLRKSVQKNTWIFVADTSFRLYVGIKDSGAFQHSSFLQGSRISAAGLIQIRNGRLASLSPLSGHYRPPAANFRAFTQSLKEAGVDMSRVSISKSYAVLVGLEAYMKTRQRGKDLLKRLSQHGRHRADGDDILGAQDGEVKSGKDKINEPQK